MNRSAGIEIREDGFTFLELGLVEKNALKEDKFDRLTPDTREVNIVDVDDRSSSSGEEHPQNYKVTNSLLYSKK